MINELDPLTHAHTHTYTNTNTYTYTCTHTQFYTHTVRTYVHMYMQMNLQYGAWGTSKKLSCLHKAYYRPQAYWPCQQRPQAY